MDINDALQLISIIVVAYCAWLTNRDLKRTREMTRWIRAVSEVVERHPQVQKEIGEVLAAREKHNIRM